MSSLLNVKEASEQLKCSRWTLYRLCKRGELSFSKKSYGLVFKAQDLEAWLDRNRTQAHSNFKYRLTESSKSNNVITGGDIMARKTKKCNARHYGYGNVYQRKPGGNWIADFYVNGKRIQKTISKAQNKEQAELILMQEKVKSFDEGQRIEQREKNIGFREFAKIYHEDYMMTTRRNFKTDTYRLQTLSSYFKNTDLRTITPFAFERFRASRMKKGNSKSTTNRYLQLMKRMFSLAIEEKYLSENILNKVRCFSEKDNRVERILTEDEERKLMENCSENLKPIITVALNTGMRKSEILNLEWNRIDFEARRIKLVKTKSGKIRYIPMNEIINILLKILKAENGQNPFVFLNPKTGKLFLDMKTPFKRACRISGIQGLRFHDLRHTFATRLILAGIDIGTVSDLLGHSSISITQRYIHINEDRKREAVEILNKKSDKEAPMVTNMVTLENQSELIS